MWLRFCWMALLALILSSCSDDPARPDDNPDTDSDPLVVPQEIVSWLQANAHPFSTPEAGSGFDDLQFLREMIGEARVVSLGEATHGTREFFQMKHRVLEFLVKEMDFNLFAIEATWPESNRVNEYVHGGEGDPAVLLSGLYFWTWNTQEVLDMIHWMRAHNEAPGGDPTVSFLGFDMQYPGMAMYNVIQFLREVDPPAGDQVHDLYGCMRLFANTPRGFSNTYGRYADQTEEYRDDCLASLLAIQDSLSAHEEEYTAASSPEEFAVIERSARLVVQYEDMASSRTDGARDRYMAENAIWLLDQGGPDAKIVLWAHNGHVGDYPIYGDGQSMGYHLRQHYGDDMVIAAFDFYQGEFQAITRNSSGTYTGLDDHSVGPPPVGSYEYYFHSAGMERMVLDVRGVAMGSLATSWLAGPRLMRSIGAVYTPTNPSAYMYQVRVPVVYDLVIYFDRTTPAVGLPFQYPAGW
jgi:erythromycin esterase